VGVVAGVEDAVGEAVATTSVRMGRGVWVAGALPVGRQPDRIKEQMIGNMRKRAFMG
jgi:hypothetical protein